MQIYGIAPALKEVLGLERDIIMETVIAFKRKSNIRSLAVQAGFKDKKLDKIVDYITLCQKNLGADVNKFLFLLGAHIEGLELLDDSFAEKQIVEKNNSEISEISESY